MDKKRTLHPVHQVYDGVFNSYSGLIINLKEPTKEMIVLDDIAMGLSNICRFGGQIPEFYSVLKHSLLVYALAPPELSAMALLHDAAEAYLGDIIKPLKVVMGGFYDDIEAKFQKVIFEKMGVDEKQLSKIKPFDIQALQMEHDHFFDVRRSPLNNILKMFYDDLHVQSHYAQILVPSVDWIKVYKDLVYENCPNALKNELQSKIA